MSSYVLSPAATVSQLKELLSSRYRLDDGHVSTLKEIVQNADDAEAKRLVLVLLWKGIEEAKNTLLHGPALVCVNDGSFEGRHEEAMRTLSLTSKAEDATTIGRFGLGQKSVFHLAEAYFYLGWSKDEPGLRADVLNPWAGNSGDPGHRDWDDFADADKDAVLGRLAQWTGPREPNRGAFVLYLPLRRPEHCRPRSGGVITQNFPGVEALAGDLMRLVELGHLLPQLHHVEMLETWEVAESGPRQLASARWIGAEPRLSRPREGATLDRHFRGRVEISSGDDWETRLQFFSYERVVTDPRLSALKRSLQWPTRLSNTSDNDVNQVPEQAVPHGAATIILRMDRGAETSVTGLEHDWAVFLPLGGGRDARQDLRESRWRLWLHGYFFPDSGRRDVLGIDAPSSGSEPKTENDVRVRWNALVRDTVTLPCLLPAVRAAIDGSEPDLGEQLARELAQSALWQRVRTVAAAEHGLVWGPRLRDGAALIESGAREVRSNSRLVPVPRPGPDEMASPGVTAVLIALTSVERREQMIIVWNTGPHLAPSDGWHPWAERWERRLAPPPSGDEIILPPPVG